ncbi:hypothetical protein ACTFIZ_010956 [Dictyostelium cf. discoideum]
MSINYRNLKTLEDISLQNEEQFKSSFWLNRKQFITLYILLHDFDDSVIVNDCLIFCNYIKQYPTFRQLCNMTGHSTATLQQKIKKIVALLNEILEEDQFDFEDRLEISPLVINNLKIYGVIDTVLFKIECPSHSDYELQKLYYSEKHKCHGIKFEVIVDLFGNIIWVSQIHYEGATHDLYISRLSGLTKLKLEDNERILGDLGYISEDLNNFFITPHKEPITQLHDSDIVIDDYLHKYRLIIENLFGRKKSSLGIYKCKFRGDIQFFSDIIKSTFYITGKIIIPSEPLRKIK